MEENNRHIDYNKIVEKEPEGELETKGYGGLKQQLSFEIVSCFKLACKQDSRLSTGCKVLNDFLRGGFLPRRIYEVYGESGAGKTQFAIQLLL